MSLEKAIKITKIFAEDDISKLSKKSFEFVIGNIKYYSKNKVFEKITSKATEMVKWLTEEIVLAKANDVYESFTEEEMDQVLTYIAEPVMVKLINTMLKPSDAFFLKVSSLDIELVKKFIELVREEDPKTADELEETLKEIVSMKSKGRKVLN